jgi:hypothetical protein
MEHDFDKRRRGAGRNDLPPEALFHQLWYQPRMIDMGVGEEEAGYFRGLKGERTPILRILTLLHAAVDEKLHVVH